MFYPKSGFSLNVAARDIQTYQIQKQQFRNFQNSSSIQKKKCYLFVDHLLVQCTVNRKLFL